MATTTRRNTITALKPQIGSTNLEATIQSTGFDIISTCALAEDFKTTGRFPAGILTIDVDGRNLGKDDATPTPVVLAIFDDVNDDFKQGLVDLFGPEECKTWEPRERAHFYDEKKMEMLQKTNRLDFQQLVDEDGKFVILLH